jgi:hypothetical protein
MCGQQEDSQNSHSGAKAETHREAWRSCCRGPGSVIRRIIQHNCVPISTCINSTGFLLRQVGSTLIVEHTAPHPVAAGRCANGCRLEKAYTVVLYNSSGR